MRYKVIIPELGFTDKKPFDKSNDIEYLIAKIKKLRKTMNTNIYILDTTAKVMRGYVYVVISKDYMRRMAIKRNAIYSVFV